jgi:CRISPR-associated protein Cas2
MHVVAYDISDDGRRLRLSRLLEGYGVRVQYSVFECDLTAPQHRRLLRELARLMVAGDAVRIYHIANVERDVLVLGGPAPHKAAGVIIA